GGAANLPPIAAAELGRALGPAAECGLGCVEPRAQHQPTALREAQVLRVPERAHRRHALEVKVKRRRAHPHVLRERLEPSHGEGPATPRTPDKRSDFWERAVPSPVIPLWGLLRRARSWPDRVSQRRTVKSPEQDTSCVPSGLKATACT